MSTPETLFGVSKGDFFEWEALRRSGVMNMWGARETLGLSKEEFSAFIRHYPEMQEAWLKEFEEGGFAEVMTFSEEATP